MSASVCVCGSVRVCVCMAVFVCVAVRARVCADCFLLFFSDAGVQDLGSAAAGDEGDPDALPRLVAGARCLTTLPEAMAEADEDGMVMCEACYDDKPANQFFALSCSHAFCDSCWRGHLATSIETLGNTAVSDTLCPAAPDCSMRVDELAWKQLAAQVRPPVCVTTALPSPCAPLRTCLTASSAP